MQAVKDELAAERRKMEDANGYLKKLYEDKIGQLEKEVAQLNVQLQRSRETLETTTKLLDDEKANVIHASHRHKL